AVELTRRADQSIPVTVGGDVGGRPARRRRRILDGEDLGGGAGGAGGARRAAGHGRGRARRGGGHGEAERLGATRAGDRSGGGGDELAFRGRGDCDQVPRVAGVRERFGGLPRVVPRDGAGYPHHLVPVAVRRVVDGRRRLRLSRQRHSAQELGGERHG